MNHGASSGSRRSWLKDLWPRDCSAPHRNEVDSWSGSPSCAGATPMPSFIRTPHTNCHAVLVEARRELARTTSSVASSLDFGSSSPDAP